MGEAKRRKQAGVYPDGGPVEQFRVPGGKLGITVEVDNEPPSTVLFEVEKVADVLAATGRVKDRPAYYDLVRGLAKEFVSDRRRGDDLRGASIGILWTALYHPKHGARMRAAVSRSLRDEGKAHITWRFDAAHGLAIALAESFVDMDGILAAAPKDTLITAGPLSGDDLKPN